jgi:hypothetical protein
MKRPLQGYRHLGALKLLAGLVANKALAGNLIELYPFISSFDLKAFLPALRNYNL